MNTRIEGCFAPRPCRVFLEHDHDCDLNTSYRIAETPKCILSQLGPQNILSYNWNPKTFYHTTVTPKRLTTSDCWCIFFKWLRINFKWPHIIAWGYKTVIAPCVHPV